MKVVLIPYKLSIYLFLGEWETNVEVLVVIRDSLWGDWGKSNFWARDNLETLFCGIVTVEVLRGNLKSNQNFKA